MRDITKVVLLVETARGFGRDLLRGISRYARLHGPWSFHITPGDYKQVVPEITRWGGNGIIARIPNTQVARAIVAAKVPTIALGLTDDQLRPENPLSKLSAVSSNPVEISRFAADHLLARKYRQYAYVGSDDRPWSGRRESEYYNYLTARGFHPFIYRPPRKLHDRVWEREQMHLADWLSQLPTPIGLFACDDERGRKVLEACALVELRVPEDVSVVGVDNDEVLCDLSDPPLSSVSLNAEAAGYRAAELLDGMMHGRIRKPRRIVVEALRVVTRRSTDSVVVGDERVAKAIQFIRRNNGRDISIEQVAKEAGTSRRTLEKRFRQSMGRSILEEIQIVRLERCKKLLLETAYPVSMIASMAGFGSTTYFIQFFQKRVGKTPRRFRVALAG